MNTMSPVLAALCLGLTACGGALSRAPEPRAACIRSGGGAELALPDLDGRVIPLAPSHGAPLVVALLHLGRPDAEREIVAMQRLQARLGSGARVVVIAALDGDAAREADVRQLVKDRGVELPVLVLQHAYDAPAWAAGAHEGSFVTILGARGGRTVAREALDGTISENVASIADLGRCSPRVAAR